MIPEHLRKFDWYPGQLAWLALTYGARPEWTVPKGTVPCRADLSGADLSGANLSLIVLRGADLTHADLIGADLRYANLCDANLGHANLTHANLSGANLRGATLGEAGLNGADLEHARGITSIGPVGSYSRMLYGVRHADGVVMVQAGCFWGPVEELRAAIRVRYADGSGREQFRESYLSACDYLQAWGKTQQ